MTGRNFAPRLLCSTAMRPNAILRCAAIVAVAALVGFGQSDPWEKTELLQPAELAAALESKQAKQPFLICTAFPNLYRAKHIVNAKFAGPGSKPEGIEALKKLVEGLPKDTDIVLYCGCCPMKVCPNMRPAFRTLKELGFTKVRALEIPTNMHTDWYSKGYPSEAGPASGGAN